MFHASFTSDWSALNDENPIRFSLIHSYSGTSLPDSEIGMPSQIICNDIGINVFGLCVLEPVKCYTSQQETLLLFVQILDESRYCNHNLWVPMPVTLHTPPKDIYMDTHQDHDLNCTYIFIILLHQITSLLVNAMLWRRVHHLLCMQYGICRSQRIKVTGTHHLRRIEPGEYCLIYYRIDQGVI